MANDAPDFIPAESSPDFIPLQAEKKPAPSFWQRIKAGFAPDKVVMDSGENPQLGAPLGSRAPIAKQVSEAGALSSIAGLGMGGESPMGMPKANLADVAAGIKTAGKGLGNMRLRAPGPELGSLENPGPMSSLSESPNYPQILAGRAASRLSAKEALQGVPAESLTKSPSYPKILAGRALARDAAREALETKMQTGSAPRISKSGVLRIPEPREALPTDTPGYLSSIPRERLPGLAMQGYPGAGELLKNLGKQVIYVMPEDYPGPRASRLRPFVLPNAAD